MTALLLVTQRVTEGSLTRTASNRISSTLDGARAVAERLAIPRSRVGLLKKHGKQRNKADTDAMRVGIGAGFKTKKAPAVRRLELGREDKPSADELPDAFPNLQPKHRRS